MKKPIIFVDMDGVLVNFIGGVAKVHDTTEDALYSRWEPGRFEVAPSLGFRREDQIWAAVDRSEGFWADLEPYPWFVDLVQLLREYGRIYILSTPSHDPGSLDGKLRWLHRHFGPRFRDYILTAKKHLLAAPGRILVDDKDSNCTSFERAGGTSIVFPRHWNENHSQKDDPLTYVATRLGLAFDLAFDIE